MRKWRYIVAVCIAMVMTVSLAACTDREENGGINVLEPIEMETESQKEETDKDAQEIESQETESPENAAAEKNLDTEDAGQNISMPSVTIVGSIQSLGDGSFSISRANVNSNVMVSTDETVNVVYSDSTEFEVCTSTDGGITASFAAGTSADLQKERIVDIEGAYEGSDFVAQKITIMIFG